MGIIGIISAIYMKWSFFIYVLYKMHLRLTTSKTFYGALIFVGTYFKSNINIILLCNTMFYSKFLIF